MFNISRYRIFILAIAASLVWHVFWLSAVKVVSEPSNRQPVKFSKVSFLGPFLERSAINLRVQPKERAFLEKRYLNTQASSVGNNAFVRGNTSHKYESDARAGLLNDKELAGFIDEALSGPNPEPDYSAE